jgi:hypothetical protein
VVNATDFSLLKGNFGQAGCPALDPGGQNAPPPSSDTSQVVGHR